MDCVRVATGAGLYICLLEYVDARSYVCVCVRACGCVCAVVGVGVLFFLLCFFVYRLIYQYFKLFPWKKEEHACNSCSLEEQNL